MVLTCLIVALAYFVYQGTRLSRVAARMTGDWLMERDDFIQGHVRRNVSPCAPNYVPFCLPVAYLQREGDEVVVKPPHMELFSPEDNRAFNAEVAMREPSDPTAWLLGAKWAARMTFFEYIGSDAVVADLSPTTAAIALRVIIRAMAAEARKIGAKFVVLNLPHLVRGRVQPPPQELTNAIAGEDLTFVDFSTVAADYHERHATGTLVQGDDPHPNALADRMIAETLATAIRPLLASDTTPAGQASAFR